MLDADTKRIINNARDILVGKVPNPQSQVDLITIAMIYKFMDDMDLQNYEDHGKRIYFVDDIEPYAFSKIMDQKLGNQARLNLYAEALDKLPFAKSVPELFRTIFRGAFLPFRDPATLTMFLKEINNFTYDNSETLGNAFEYLLSIMGSQGDAGQFRTPRHIIDFIVNVVKPAKTDTILDPACGTAGFLISAYL
ncbi:MAG: N-6 DNA methylase, partial [Alphaproteobacteria bacterium]|nr:N-6 DNA methylase [Alphaproteobacteria bacterium]